MAATRREFLKTGLIAGAGLAMPGVASASAASPRTDALLPPAAAALATAQGATQPAFTRGVGLYPGAPDENFSPELVLDPAAPYRNLALLRPAFGSSSYDYNLTPQLITDGLTDTTLPSWMSTVVDGQILPKPEREIIVDHFESAVLELPSRNPVVELHLGGADAPEVDRMELFVIVPAHITAESLLFTISVSDDGHTWREVGSAPGGTPIPPENYPPDLTHGALLLRPSIAFSQPFRGHFYRASFKLLTPAAAGAGTANAGTTEAAMAMSAPSISWRLGQMAFFRGQQRINLGGPYTFTSAWKSAGLDEEWVYVDLGSRFPIDRVTLHWIARAAEGKLQVSDDAHTWHDLQPLSAGDGPTDDLHVSATTRYVRVLMTRPATEHGYILSELEVFGHGGFLARPKPAPTQNGNRLHLAGGNWKVQRAANTQGEALSIAGFRDADWIPATVPGTVLTSFYNVGAVPDPNFGQNQLQISDSFFYADFWYRTEFTPAAPRAGELQWLTFDGINWKADIFLNGTRLGHIDGGFTRGRFDVTGKLKPGQPNALAVLIHRNDTPGSCKQKTFESTGKNGGALGADNPTYHASIGWDWIPTIRGRNTGVWADVALLTTGEVTLEDPLVTSTLPLPDTSHADLTLEFFAVNHAARPFTGTVHGRFGTVVFEQKLTIPASTSQTVRLSADTHKQLRLQNPQLWWPVGYGDPHLYDVELTLEARGKTVASKAFKAGIRQMTADEKGGILHLFVNGRRLIAKGGSWGFGESMLRFRAREYDACVRYHREMNFNMIRNWVGQIGDDAFFEACDKYGVMIWQDFWLANPWDGPVPENDAMFLANSEDFLRRIRRHASIGIYCGRNEWFPPKPLDDGFRSQLATLHPGIPYVGSSADGPVSGHGPYRALPSAEYFAIADKKLHSEIGAPAIPPMDSIRAMMPEHALWPQGLDWGLHDFTLQGAQGGSAFRTLVEESYGGATNVEDWVTLGEMVSYDAYRAMFEAQSVYRMGALLWMSHPCWPSFVWQTYDWYFDPTATYFASKLGAEPLHIQWNSLAETIEVVNYSAGNLTGLTAQVEIFNMDGRSAFRKSAQLDSAEDSTGSPIHMEYPAGLSPVHFLRLTLMQGSTVRSTNFYLRGREQASYGAIRTLGKAKVRANTTAEQRGDRWFLTTQVQNTSNTPALFLRLKAVRESSGDRITPVIYDDNYLSLMPNETRTVHTEVSHADTRGERPTVIVGGFNVITT